MVDRLNYCQQCGTAATSEEEWAVGACLNCGGEWHKSWQFCRVCGVARANALLDETIGLPLPYAVYALSADARASFASSLTLVTSEICSEFVVCPECQAELSTEVSYCSECGARLPASEAGEIFSRPASVIARSAESGLVLPFHPPEALSRWSAVSESQAAASEWEVEAKVSLGSAWGGGSHSLGPRLDLTAPENPRDIAKTESLSRSEQAADREAAAEESALRTAELGAGDDDYEYFAPRVRFWHLAAVVFLILVIALFVFLIISEMPPQEFLDKLSSFVHRL